MEKKQNGVWWDKEDGEQEENEEQEKDKGYEEGWGIRGAQGERDKNFNW